MGELTDSLQQLLRAKTDKGVEETRAALYQEKAERARLENQRQRLLNERMELENQLMRQQLGGGGGGGVMGPWGGPRVLPHQSTHMYQAMNQNFVGGADGVGMVGGFSGGGGGLMQGWGGGPGVGMTPPPMGQAPMGPPLTIHQRVGPQGAIGAESNHWGPGLVEGSNMDTTEDTDSPMSTGQ